MKKKYFPYLIILIAGVAYIGHFFSRHSGYCHQISENPKEIQKFIGAGKQVDLEKIDQLPIKTSPNHWKYIPFLLSGIASTVYPNLYFPAEMYADITGPEPDPANLAVLVHEHVHLERMKNQPLWWNIKYLTSKKFRIQEEFISIATEMQYRKEQGLDYDIDRKAKHFASSVYAWACTYDDAHTALEVLWSKIKKS